MSLHKTQNKKSKKLRCVYRKFGITKRFNIEEIKVRIAVLNVKWPNIVINDTVYAATRQIPWCQVITRRELSLFGHLFRLSDDTPAKIALQYSLRATKKPRGRILASRLSTHDKLT